MDADTVIALRTILENQYAIMTALQTMAELTPQRAELLATQKNKTQEAAASSFLCDHEWEDGYSMNGPTKTCRKCRKFMRD